LSGFVVPFAEWANKQLEPQAGKWVKDPEARAGKVLIVMAPVVMGRRVTIVYVQG
jgi:hypothetical protein